MPDRKTKQTVRNAGGKRSRSSPTTGSYFLSLELENVRCFSEKQTLDLSDGNGRPARWTILLGENGTGKTTVLQIARFPGPSDRGVLHSRRAGHTWFTLFLLPSTMVEVLFEATGDISLI